MRAIKNSIRSRFHPGLVFRRAPLLVLLLVVAAGRGSGRPSYRSAFFAAYPGAVGTALDTLPSKSGHCGVCHLNFNGRGPKNPYGIALEDQLDSGLNTSEAINALHTEDSDGDGFITATEMDVTGPYSNTPTFPGLAPGAPDLSALLNIPLAEVEPYLVPTITVDTTPPSVTVDGPNGGESLTANQTATVTWTASDASGIAFVHIYQSLDDGATYTPVALGLANSGSCSWIPANRPTTTARLRIVAVDNATNTNNDESDAAFTIESPTIVPAPPVPTTLRDFDLPGTQPFEGGSAAAAPADCGTCHGGYGEPEVEPYRVWQGSMMALASLDPLFLANLTIANQDAPESGDLCLRCHNSRGWMQGRSVPTDGSSMREEDMIGVMCDLCHRMVDPVYKPGISPPADADILAALRNPGTEYGNGMLVVDPTGIKRGPYADATEAQHPYVESPFHREAAFCGTCHDVSNPAFTKNTSTGEYEPNSFDAPATDFSAHSMAPVERTYSEWLHSEYNTPSGVLAPEFAGNKADGRVATCQDCHMRDVVGKGCNEPGAPIRQDLPLHDMTGGSTWLPPLIAAAHPTRIDAGAVADGVARATYMLEHAATLEATSSSGELVVKVTNETGHKLPTGYPEGRRIWVNVRFLDAESNLVGESGAYDPATGVLTRDPEAKIYEVHFGIGDNISSVVGLPVGPSLHFVLNNAVFEDNRIPPRGFTNLAFEAFGGAPVGHSYDDGQYWDETPYAVPPTATSAEVRLYYQSTSKEFIEFLRDENVTDTLGEEMYDLWNDNGKCPPVLMEQLSLPVQPLLDPDQDRDGDGIPNGFEEQFGLDPFNPADALLDLDMDGLTNLEEAAYGSSPNDPASANRPFSIEVDDAGTIYFALSYVRSRGYTTASIAAEVSSDLLSWESGPVFTTIVSVTDNGDTTETVVERMNIPIAASPREFMRLRVTPAPP